MKKIIIKNIKIENFKGIAKANFEFNDKHNELSAENGAGKSSVKQSWEWVLGQTVPEVLPNLNNKEIDNLTTSVEITINVDNFDYVLKRVSKGNYKLNKETDTMNKVSNENTYSIDGIEMTLRNYQGKIGELIGNGAFENIIMLTDKEHFNNKLHWNDRRKLLLEIAGVETSMSSLLDDERFANIKDLLAKKYATSDIKSMLRREKTQYKSNIDRNNILIEQKVTELNELSEINYKEKEQELNKLKVELDKLNTASKEELKEDASQKIKNKLADIQTKINELEITDINTKRNLTDGANKLYRDALELKNEHDNISAELERTKHRLEHINDIEHICPTCLREKDKTVLEQLEQDKEKTIAELTESIEKFEKDKKSFAKKFNDKNKEYLAEKEKVDTFAENKEIEVLRDSAITLKNELEQANSENTTSLSSDRKTSLEGEISSLERILANKDFIKNGKQLISDWKENNMELADKVINVEVREDELQDFVQTQTDLITGLVNDKFSNNVSWALYKPTYKDGEGGIQEDCTLLYKGKRYDALSTGEKNIADLETLKSLQDYFNVNIAVFSDNAESITIDHSVNMQLIELKAEKGKKLDNVVYILDMYGGADKDVIKE